jgi:hypothetical protein
VSVLFDATFLLPLFTPSVPGPLNPNTNQPLEFLRERIDALIDGLDHARTKIIIPTPALSELLVGAGAAGPEYLNRLREYRAFKIESFDERAAVEAAFQLNGTLEQMGKKAAAEVADTWAKVKFDHQIVAIAKVNSVSIIYSDDRGVRTFGERAKMTVVGLSALPLPQTAAQMPLPLSTTSEKSSKP